MLSTDRRSADESLRFGAVESVTERASRTLFGVTATATAAGWDGCARTFKTRQGACAKQEIRELEILFAAGSSFGELAEVLAWARDRHDDASRVPRITIGQLWGPGQEYPP